MWEQLRGSQSNDPDDKGDNAKWDDEDRDSHVCFINVTPTVPKSPYQCNVEIRDFIKFKDLLRK